MVYTFKQLTDSVLRHLDEVADPTSLALAKDYINQAHQQRCLQADWPWMMTREQTFTTEANRHTYALDHRYRRVLYLLNRTTGRYVEEVPRRQLQEDVNLRWNTAVGQAAHYMLWERTPVKQQPSSASVLTLTGTSASDNVDTYNVVVKGVDANGNELAEVFTPAGTTPVVGTVTFVEITGVSKASPWNGNLTLTSNSGTVTNLTLMPWEMGRSYPQAFIIESPTAGDVIEHRGFKHPEFLVNDYDQPDIPGPFASILIYDALMMFATYNADTSGGEANIWAEQRDRLERAMYATLFDTNTIGSKGEYIHGDIDEYDAHYY